MHTNNKAYTLTKYGKITFKIIWKMLFLYLRENGFRFVRNKMNQMLF